MKADLTNRSLLDWLVRLGIACRLPVDGECFYLVEIGAEANARPDPPELLMAAKPAGVVCYFSALAFYSLTTQPPSHHHVAELTQPRPAHGRRDSRTEADDRPTEASRPGRRARQALGKLLFRYQGVPFYFTRRSARLVPGVQSRDYGPRVRIRITTLEQTLLDTLFRPLHCGGPEVVFEAWEEGMASRRLDEERLVEHLRAMAFPATARRLAVLLKLRGHTLGTQLRRLLDEHREAIDRHSPFAPIPLRPGLDYQALDEEWLVRTP
jgi:hypothetical protein